MQDAQHRSLPDHNLQVLIKESFWLFLNLESWPNKDRQLNSSVFGNVAADNAFGFPCPCSVLTPVIPHFILIFKLKGQDKMHLISVTELFNYTDKFLS